MLDAEPGQLMSGGQPGLTTADHHHVNAGRNHLSTVTDAEEQLQRDGAAALIRQARGASNVQGGQGAGDRGMLPLEARA